MQIPLCRVRLDARRQEAKAAAAAVQELTQQERKLEGEVEEAGKAVRARKEEADALKDTENADVQHVQVYDMKREAQQVEVVAC